MRPDRYTGGRMGRYPQAALALTAFLAACQAEPKRARLEEIAQLLASDAPVKAEVGAGELPLERDPYALAEPENIPLVRTPQDGGAAQAPVSAPVPLRQNPYIRFGERIIVRQFPGGEVFITKPYSLPKGRAEKMKLLMDALEPFHARPRPPKDPATGTEPPLEPAWLEYEILAGWDEELYSALKPTADGVPPEAKPVVLSDLLIVTASYELLEQFEDFLDLFAAAGIPQIELEAKIIEVVETDQFDLGGNASFLFGGSNFVSSFGVDLPNIGSSTEAVLDLGAVQSSLEFDAVIEAIRTLDNVQIDSRGKTVVRAGGVAYIESTTEVPFSEIKTLNTAGDFTAATTSKKIGVQLYISPRIIGTKTLALDVHLIGSQQTGSQTTFSSGNGQVIDVPVIAYRTAKTVVYLEPGQTLVIGGLSSERERELVNKVPILGDIPLLGFFFRSKFTRKEKQHVLFAISPRILQNSDFEGEF
jgi:type II secretory pathway component GspD/PulD (secretin)